MRISRIIAFIMIFLLSSISLLVYFLYPKSGTADSFLLKDINKDSITRIRLYEYNLEEAREIQDKAKIQEFLSQLSKLNLEECSDNISVNHKDVYDIILSNKNGYLSKDGTEKISELQISLYNTGYIVWDREGTLKSKYFKIKELQEVQKLKELISN
ncbi:hypothetical protein B0P06_005167 [Clostridium saccharoperbutylacetonicum]|uniref:Uncharacterized protein n=1 Tax=Clostridium saccharoperbutylacetonicum N1-4(HMT) TaxID=931276 RepID=M1MF62_9CLOT|nr:hypothetical protein [Clostridium saccharoperbutylacetonicum]AGF56559.1 hypothetical protein Cspa_c27960 [Clostridium saccharoperbutylacetonicum N1-4(HMT)]NRT62690.1 hypothetical protein [Clostridium saccharoperbutylacetonicum]NSB26039.1 hypothetical protein [Clostridium saccharoperbutylacetonicum]NSB45396.1 hypothetical protein [Clostridium saccharoperbutylacetonicum]